MPDPQQSPPVNICTPLPQKPMPRATRVLLQHEYEVCPEEVERHLRDLQNEKPTTEGYKQLVDDLRTQLHDVPLKPYRHLVQHEQDQQEKVTLRAQLSILKRDNRDLQRQLATYRELQHEIELLNDQVAAYRHLHVAGASAYVSTDQ
ncbi:hypothetical protein ABVT39_025582 [Epinephelus coioides]